jgi:hypothetical protein
MRPEKPIDDRRFFFRQLARETVVWVEELCGRPSVKLTDLPSLPPEAIAALVPQICPGVQIVPEELQISARLPGATGMVVLFESGEANLMVFNGFNGMNTIEKVASDLSAATEWSRERSLDHVKEMFFRLVRLRVCAPANRVLP